MALSASRVAVTAAIFVAGACGDEREPEPAAAADMQDGIDCVAVCPPGADPEFVSALGSACLCFEPSSALRRGEFSYP